MHFLSTLLLAATSVSATVYSYGIDSPNCNEVFSPPYKLYPGDTVYTPYVAASFFRNSKGECYIEFDPDDGSACTHWSWVLDVTTQTKEGPKVDEVGQDNVPNNADDTTGPYIYCGGDYYMSYSVQGYPG